MQVIALIWGILAGMAVVVAFFPCLGALNWMVIPFSGLGLILSVIALTTADPEEPRGLSIAGVVLCGIATILGLLRLMIGGGVV